MMETFLNIRTAHAHPHTHAHTKKNQSKENTQWEDLKSIKWQHNNMA